MPNITVDFLLMKNVKMSCSAFGDLGLMALIDWAEINDDKYFHILS